MQRKIRVLAADMQPITPAIGGGRLRLLGVYHKLKPNISCTYVGSYDWPSDEYRDQQLSMALRELVTPLSPAHFEIDGRLRKLLHHQTIIDSLFGILSPLSTNYCERLWTELKYADVVILDHPWVYPLIADRLGSRPLIYNSQNVEGLLKYELYSNDALSREVKKQVIAVEAAIIDAADCIFCCSAEDIDNFNCIYGAPRQKMLVIPNGTFVEQLVPPPGLRFPTQRMRGIFLGSNFPPNVEAAGFIANKLAPAYPEIDFVLAGHVGSNQIVQALTKGRPNIIVTGELSDSERLQTLQLADFAVNPMESGSGTNIKMLDFMAVALPIISTQIGARGIPASEGIISTKLEEFVQAVAFLKALDVDERNRLGNLNRKLVCAEFAWERISVRAADVIEEVYKNGKTSKGPQSSITSIPSLTVESTHYKRLGIISTHDIKCGVAGYTEDLAQGLRTRGCETHIFACHPLVADRLRLSNLASSTTWLYDDWHYSISKFDTSLITKKARDLALEHISIQYQTLFSSFNELMRLIDNLHSDGLSCSVTLHNSAAMSPDQFAALAKRGTRLFVHNKSEVERVSQSADVCYLPFGVQNRHAPNSVSAFSVGTFGFLRPHKGLYELISAFDLLRTAEPQIHLRAYCAEYPNSESKLEKMRCMALIDKLDLQNHVELNTRFLPKTEILDKLVGCAINVLPYHDVDEDASGAISYCAAACRPLIISHSKIFKDLGNVAYHFESVDAGSIALAILGVLRNSELRVDLEQRVNHFAKERSWSRVAARFLTAIGEQRSPPPPII
jgi:glycosyltransferase involved in cell wall biosynthesis